MQLLPLTTCRRVNWTHSASRSPRGVGYRCTVTTMDKCYMFTAILLVYLVAFVDSQVSYECKKDEGKDDDKVKNLDLRFEFPSDVFDDADSTNHYSCNVIPEIPVITLRCIEMEIPCPVSCLDAHSECLSQWSDWTACVISNGTGIRNRYRDVTCAKVEPTCCLPFSISLIDRQDCIFYAGDWSSWSDCTSSGEWYRHRSLNCNSNRSTCLPPSNGSSFEISKCTPDPDSSTEGSRQANTKEDEKRYTLTEIILVAFGCLVMGVILTSLLFILYLKRTQQGCFSKHVKECQGDSKQQSDPDLKYLTERVVVKKYDSENPKSADLRNDNKAEETQYQSLISNQVDNDQLTYDKLAVKEPSSHRHSNQPSSSRTKQTGNAEEIDDMTNLQHKTDGIYEYSRDSDLGGHNYFILESENISRESKARNLGRPETYVEAGHEVKDSAMGTGDEQSDAAHEYFALEHVENGHSED